MAIITVLSKEISELIAAGEVIERPASVIKELVENSIDAGAKHITVEIKNGGTTYMRIVDDGSGIAEEDVSTAFLRHATSKIVTRSDLDSIMTLGFRGEALASIAAVSKVEVLTKQKNDDYGVHYIIEGSVEKLNEKTGCPDGTTIIIRNLFYNVPARQKFMKKDVTEANAVAMILQKMALSHPETAVKLIRDNRLEFNSAGDGLLFSAIYSVYGKNFAHDMIEVCYEESGIKVYGHVIKPLYSKHNRSFQNFFVNGRYVKSLTCNLAIEEAYKNLIMIGKFPACVLKIEIPPDIVDVNVHPAKIEVRFSNEKFIFNSVYFAVKNALMKSGLIYEFQMKRPVDWTEKEDTKKDFKQQPLTEVNNILHESRTALNNSEIRNEQSFSRIKIDNSVIVMPDEEDNEESKQTVSVNTIDSQAKSIKQENTVFDFKYIKDTCFEKNDNMQAENGIVYKDKADRIRVVGEAFLNYIIAEAEDRIIMIDKHAAHERIIYEKIKSQDDGQNSQFLITPCKILLPLDEYDAMLNGKNILENMGFRLNFEEKPYVAAIAVPVYLESLDMDEVIPEIAENLHWHKVNPQTDMLDDMFHTIACKAAIKANDKNSLQELQLLAEQVYYNDNIRHCPHGRPVMFTLTKRELEKQFGRG